jgi:hypothetical protein
VPYPYYGDGVIEVNPLFSRKLQDVLDRYRAYPTPSISKELEHTMANRLQPAGRTTPVAAYIALRDNGPFGNSNRIRGVHANNPASPRNAAGVSTAKLGGVQNGVTIQVNAHI